MLGIQVENPIWSLSSHGNCVHIIELFVIVQGVYNSAYPLLTYMFDLFFYTLFFCLVFDLITARAFFFNNMARANFVAQWAIFYDHPVHAVVRDSSSILGVWLTRKLADNFDETVVPNDKSLPVICKFFKALIILPTLFVIDKSFHLPKAYFYQV